MSDRFRAPVVLGLAAPTTAEAPVIDREKGIIYGASAMQAVEALGHNVLIDDITLAQVRDLGNAAPMGIKSRFTHPGMCEDGMGKMLGRQKNFRIQGDKVVGDLHLSDSAARSPAGDLRNYVLDLAKEDPTAFGMSVVISTFRTWKLANGSEIRVDDSSLRSDHGFSRPDTATTKLPFVRVTALHASDVVDEPAANRNGMFSAFAATTNADASAAFDQLDALRDQLHLSLDDARAFIGRYFAARTPATTTPKDAPVKLSLQAFTALLLANVAFSKELSEFAQDPKNAEADESAFTAKLTELKSAADQKAIADRDTALAAEKSARSADKLAADKTIADLTAQLAAATKRADGLAALGQGAAPGSQVGGDATAHALGGLSGDALFQAEWDRSPEVRANFGQNFKAYVGHRKEIDAKKPKG